MAMGSIELATIARLQDYTTIKQNEDNRGLAQQSNLVQQMDHDNQQKTRQVTESDNAQWHQKIQTQRKRVTATTRETAAGTEKTEGVRRQGACERQRAL